MQEKSYKELEEEIKHIKLVEVFDGTNISIADICFYILLAISAITIFLTFLYVVLS